MDNCIFFFFLLSFCNFPRRCVFGHRGVQEGGNSVAFPRRRKTMERRLGLLLFLCGLCLLAGKVIVTYCDYLNYCNCAEGRV